MSSSSCAAISTKTAWASDFCSGRVVSPAGRSRHRVSHGGSVLAHVGRCRVVIRASGNVRSRLRPYRWRVSDEQPAAPEQTFADLGLAPEVLKALADVGYETPSPIQAATIPPLLEGRDVVGLAQTGTGKTAAFALPILVALDLSQKTPQALVLAPTRELALQVSEAFEKYAAHLPGVHVLPVYGGQGYGVQLSALRRGVHVVVGTPGPDHGPPREGHARPDRAALPGPRRGRRDAQDGLRRGRRDDPRRHPGRQARRAVLGDDAGADPPASRRSTSHDPVEITVKSKTTTAPNITQRYLMVSYPQKVDALTRILEVENFEGMIVFVRTKNETETLAEKLRARGFSAMAINGDVAQVQRERTVNQLKAGKLDILVATDVAARGLDVERISHVVNYDIPTDTESYVHRIGRTGRAGRSGDAISFVTPRERYLLKRDREGHPPAADPDAAADGRRRQRHPAGPLRRRRSPRRSPSPSASTSSATSSRTTSASTTCPRSTSPPRWPSSCRASSRCCSTPSPSSASPAPEERVEPRRQGRPGPGGAREPRSGAADGDVPDRRRQAAQGRAAPDRRRARQRGRPLAAATSATSTSARTTPRRAARRPAARHARPARRAPGSPAS